jgi:hypothetical protein
MPAASLGVVAAPKVVIIVGPTGSLTDNYRQSADAVADTATAAGADVVKVYSPDATWDTIRDAVNGANVIVYMGHGNGFPNPYTASWCGAANTTDTACEQTDRDNGWGVNKVGGLGSAGDDESNMVYCGEDALLGTLSSSNARYPYCTGGITPAPGFVMIYSHACYTPGAGETGDATETIARERVRHFSYPVFALGGSAYFATDLNPRSVMDLVLNNQDMAFGQIAQQVDGYDATAQRHFVHEDVSGAEVWIQQTYAMGRNDYWYAFAGFPSATPAGGTAEMPGAPTVVKVRPADGAKWASVKARVNAWFSVPVEGLDTSSFTLVDSYGFNVPGKVVWRAAYNKAVFIPTHQLVAREWYTATLASSIHGTDGVPIATYQWTFRTKNDGDGSQQNWPSTTRLTFKQGTHTAYRFDSVGRVTSIKTSTLAGDSGANTATRRLLPGQSGDWFYVTNGLWAGYWIRQSDALFLAGTSSVQTAQRETWDPAVRLVFRMGTHTGYKFDASGAMTAQKTLTLGRASGANTSVVQAIPNQTGSWFLVVNGAFAGYWVRQSDVIYLK